MVSRSPTSRSPACYKSTTSIGRAFGVIRKGKVTDGRPLRDVVTNDNTAKTTRQMKPPRVCPTGPISWLWCFTAWLAWLQIAKVDRSVTVAQRTSPKNVGSGAPGTLPRMIADAEQNGGKRRGSG
jgi:hypothetical protein